MSHHAPESSPRRELTDDQARQLLAGAYKLESRQQPSFPFLKQTMARMESSVLCPIKFDPSERRSFGSNLTLEIAGVMPEPDAFESRSSQVLLVRSGSEDHLQFPAGVSPNWHPDRLVVGIAKLARFAPTNATFTCRRPTVVETNGGPATTNDPRSLAARSLAADAESTESPISLGMLEKGNLQRLVLEMYPDDQNIGPDESVFARVTVSRRNINGEQDSATGIVELRADEPSSDRFVGELDVTDFAESLDGKLKVTAEPLKVEHIPLLARSRLAPENQTVAFLGAYEELVSIPLKAVGDKFVIAPVMSCHQEALDAAFSDTNSLFLLKFTPTKGADA